LARLRLRTIRVRSPTAIPAIIDSIGNPGIPPPVTLDVLVDVVVTDVPEINVENDVIIAVVVVDMVETTIEVEVAPTTPPYDANRNIEASGLV
jgi:hypothetical protein